MEESNLDWEMEGGEEEMSSGKVSWLLNKGLVFGKKVLMTGMLITSAPFVVPPLIAISAFGVAASVPSGLFLASYACSEKVMSSLLPGSSPPNSPFLLPGYYFDEDQQGRGDVNVGLFEQDIDMEKEEQKQIDERVEMRIELPVHASDDEALKKETMHASDDQLLQEKTAHEKAATDDEFGRNKIPVQVRDVAVMESGGGGDEISKHDEEEMDMPIEAKSSAAAGKKSGPAGKRKGKKKGKVNEELVPKQNEEKRNDDSVKVVVDETTASSPHHHQGKVHIGDNNNGGAKAGTRKKIHHSGRLTDQETTSPAAAGLKKEGDSEEDIRKQIEAMKTIVGYKDGTPKPHASCLEELKALYIFTGVAEPQQQQESSDNIEELTHKLKFLMSIVGVK